MVSRYVDETHAQLLTRAAARPATLSAEDKAKLGDDIDLVIDSLQAHKDLITEHRAAYHHHREMRSTILAARQLEIINLARTGKLKVSQLSIAEIQAIDINPKLKQFIDDTIWAGWDKVWPGEVPLTPEDDTDNA